MFAYVHDFVIHLGGGSPRPVTYRRCVHSPQDLTIVFSTHFMVQHTNYARQETDGSGSVDALSCLCCLPRHRQPRVGNRCALVVLKDEHGHSHPFNPKLPGKREEKAYRACRQNTRRKSRKRSGLVTKIGAMQLE